MFYYDQTSMQAAWNQHTPIVGDLFKNIYRVSDYENYFLGLVVLEGFFSLVTSSILYFLLLKIKAIIQRKSVESIADSKQFEFEIGSFKLNSKLRFLTHDDETQIKLSPKENELLRLLALHVNDLMPREIALTKIWRDDNYFTSRSMDVYIAKLRKYLEKDSSLKIINVHGEGFRLMKD